MTKKGGGANKRHSDAKVSMRYQEKVARFVNGLRRDIQDLVELYEYSSLDKVLHLAIKVETQLQKKKDAKSWLFDLLWPVWLCNSRLTRGSSFFVQN